MNEDRSNPLGIGQLLPHDRARDAVHIAMIPVVAGVVLRPGQHVSVEEGKAVAGKINQWGDAKAVGVVDPYLADAVKPGERFWCFLRPGTVTALHHNWHHDSFPLPVSSTEGAKLQSEGWLRNFAEKYAVEYKSLVDQATSCDDEHGGICVGTDDVHEMGDGEKSLFWHHLGVVTGRLFSASHQNNAYWSCAC